MLYVYIGTLTFGVVYSLVASIFGHHGFDHSAADHGGGDSGDVPSPFNPLVIASAITAFGAFGLIGQLGFRMTQVKSSIFALIFSGLVGAAIFYGVVKLMYGSQSDSSFSLNDLIGIEAEIITPIPEDGLGEIVFVTNGIRYNFTARSAYGQAIGRGDKVKIQEIQGSVALVVKKVTLDDLETLEENELNDKKVKENRHLDE